MVSSVLSATVLSSVLSSFLGCVITIFLMRNTKLLEDKRQCVVSRAAPHSRRNTPANNSCCEAKASFLSRRRKPKLVLLDDYAVKNGAACLDGSPPGYFIKRGYGSGVNSWIIHFSGGAWCYDEQACYQRSQTEYGSTRYVNNINLPHQGMYSDDRSSNPDFYNWNMVFVLYCDGSSFTGSRLNPVYVNDKAIYFRGKIILESIIDDLLRRGVRKSKEVLLTGSSAGSLAVLIHADYITSRLPRTVKVRAVADSGFFVDLKTRYGAHKLREHFRWVLETHNATFGLHPACVRRTASREHWKCMCPQYFFDLIRTKVFVLQAAYDVWQIITNLAVVCTIPSYRDLVVFNTNDLRDARGNSRAVHARGDARAWRKKRETLDKKLVLSKPMSFKDFKTNSVKWHWQRLYSSPAECTKSELGEILSIYSATLMALKPVLEKEGGGLFLSPCFDHTQARYDLVWNNVKIMGKTIKEAVHEWYFEKSENNFHIGKQLSFASCVP